jgi:hypothetical protein
MQAPKPALKPAAPKVVHESGQAHTQAPKPANGSLPKPAAPKVVHESGQAHAQAAKPAVPPAYIPTITTQTVPTNRHGGIVTTVGATKPKTIISLGALLG